MHLRRDIPPPRSIRSPRTLRLCCTGPRQGLALFCVLEVMSAVSLKKPVSVFVLIFTGLLAVSLPVSAQTGYRDSFVDPILVLALLGGAAAITTSLFRLRRSF